MWLMCEPSHSRASAGNPRRGPVLAVRVRVVERCPIASTQVKLLVLLVGEPGDVNCLVSHQGVDGDSRTTRRIAVEPTAGSHPG